MEKDNKYKGIITILVLIIVAIVAYNLGSSNTGTGQAVAPTNTGNSPTAPVANVELNDNDHVKGNPDAKVTIIEYSDFECPFCSRFYTQTLQQLESEYIDTGKVKFAYKHYPLTQIHPMAQPAAEASECAGEQGMFWEYHDKIFENQQMLSDSSLRQWASDLGLDTTQFNDCLDSGKYREKVQQDLQEGQSAGIRGTPGFLINGRLVSGAQPFSVFQQAIEAEL